MFFIFVQVNRDSSKYKNFLNFIKLQYVIMYENFPMYVDKN